MSVPRRMTSEYGREITLANLPDTETFAKFFFRLLIAKQERNAKEKIAVPAAEGKE